MVPPVLPPLPLVGRGGEIGILRQMIGESFAGNGGTLLLAGESGVGKSRLARLAAEEMTGRRGSALRGRGYPVETGVPYALFADAFLPLLRKLEPGALTTLSRGGEADLAYLFPALSSAPLSRSGVEDPAELKTRLHWNFAAFLGGLAAREPLLVVLEDLQWADPSSLELLHFVSRQLSAERIFVLCTYDVAERARNPALRATERSLLSAGLARLHEIAPLSLPDVQDLVGRAFSVGPRVSGELVGLLHQWTRGNPFFLEEALRALVASGKLHERDGAWFGWEIQELELPRSVQGVVVDRVDRLPREARMVAELATVVGTRVPHGVLRAISGLPEEALLGALDALRSSGVLTERDEDGDVHYDFPHPVLRDTLYAELGLARTRALHAAVAATLERLWGDASAEHADELALHFSRAGAGPLAPRAAEYLVAAGRNALAKHADREAESYFAAALERTDGAGAEGDQETLLNDLGRARQRLGDYSEAIAIWSRVLAPVEERGDASKAAAIRRRLALACFWSGRRAESLLHADAGVAASIRGGERILLVRLKVLRSMILQEAGRAEETLQELVEALEIAAALGDSTLLARVHRALLILYTWTGPPELAREHGRRAVEFARESGDIGAECDAHWGLAVLAGFTGSSPAAAHHIAESGRLADELRSPLRRLWISEVAVEYAAAIGEWDTAISLGERSIALARALGQRMLLPRLLVWVGSLYLARGKMELAWSYLEEAWTLSGAGEEGLADVHTVVPAHMGIAAYHLARKDYMRAMEVGEAGLAIADRSGYVAWAIYRLLPLIGEAAVWLRDLDLVERVGSRLRRDSERIGHKLGLAWADGCDALALRLRGEMERAAELLPPAIAELEKVPFPADAARLRRQYAAVLRDNGRPDEAIREMRRAHEVFSRLGAEPELDAVRNNLREMGARPPVRSSPGEGVLTGRETEIARLVAERRSNKAIGVALRLSSRTVSTHLSNIFRKLGISTRAELTDRMRQGELSKRPDQS